MATTSPPRRPTPPARRFPASSSPTPTASSIAKGATARSAASPRVTSSLNATAARRASLRASPPPSIDSKDALSASLKLETEQKENLLVQIQDKEQTITSLTAHNDKLSSSLNAAEIRLDELYADQSRAEADLAQRIDIADKLREQVRELEKEKRDIQRRYNEQTSTFEAERQAFYDNEQHLKSRIQSLTQARKQPEPLVHAREESILEPEPADEDVQSPRRPDTPVQDLNDPEQEPAEMTALRLELSTLSTSYSSIQSTLMLLQTQLVDLKRVNREVQEENESYLILLRERTLSGHFNVLKQVGGDSEDDDSDDIRSLRSTGRSTLDRVDEQAEEEEQASELDPRWNEPIESDSMSGVNSRRQGRKRGASVSHSPSGTPQGESLADLPITGPGLDLAAELGRAENKDILDGVSNDDGSAFGGKRSRKDSKGKKINASENGGVEGTVPNDVDALRTEVKALKDANKALSLYASKIIDRIIAQEGFEHVLAVDYEKEPETPMAVTTVPKPPKERPQSVIVGRAANMGAQTPSTPTLSATPKLGQPPMASPSRKAQRRSLSFDWKNFSIFNTEKKPDANLRPLTLRPGAIATPPLGSARKLETQEDEDDKRERERLNATMKLMGIQPAPPASPSVMQKSFSSPGPTPTQAPTPTATTNPNRRFSFFGGLKAAPVENSDTSSLSSNGGLTQEALEHAEAEETLAALDAHERSLSAEISRGSAGGFTEIAPRASGRRSRRSQGGSSSGSTVWSAGIDEDD